MDKKAFRSRFRKIRADAKSHDKDSAIMSAMLKNERIVNADIVLMYASFGSETDTWMLFGELKKLGIPTAFPRCEADRRMTFYTVTDEAQLIDGMYGIREPLMTLPKPEISGRTVCIVPGLAFTESGGRLGYGGGYYDTFLSAHPEVFTIAPAYEAVITDELPLAEHDIAINQIITEERTVFCCE